MIAVVGLGGAGGNVADEASKLGFPTGAINFSQKDLDALENVPLKLRLIGSEGVGHDRDKAINLLAESHEVAIRFLQENFLSNPLIQVVVLSFSTGGGSGSGISPMLIELLSSLQTDKVIVAMPILPDYSEVTVSQANCSQTLEELSKLDIAVFPIDNQQARAINPTAGKNRIYETTNKSAISLLNRVLSYTDKHSKNGNFDKRDLATILSTKGIGIIAEADITTLNNNSIELSADWVSNRIHDSWQSSIFTPIEYDQVVRAGVIFDAQESMMEFLKYDKIFSKFSNGMPFDLFEGNYHESRGKVITIMTGLAWCRSRLARVDRIIEESRSKVEVAMSATENQSYESRANDIFSQIRKAPQKSKSVTDILSKYNRR